MKFGSLGLNEDLQKGIDDAGFVRCTPIQEQSLPECLSGKDVIAQSQTGSGKTAVFVLTIFNRLVSNGYAKADKPRALIMVPTRELCSQVDADARKLGKFLPVKTVAIYGGVQYEKQISAIRGGVDVVVATPGRMIDLYKSKTLSLDSIDTFVIDEADRMFDMGFAPDIRYIAGRLPKNTPRQTMLFSATIDSNVQRLSSTYMKSDTATIEIEPEQVTVDSIDQKIVYVSNEEKLPALMAILSRPDAERVIIFTNMKRTAEMLGFKLSGNDFPVEVLTGDVSQSKRERIMRDVKAGKVRFLVATDVAARGLHIEDVSHVINYDLPEEAANYVHRVGRTARAGKSGKAYSLVCEEYVLNLPEIEKFIEHKIEKEWIETEELVADKAAAYRRSRGPGGRGGAGRAGGRAGASGGRTRTSAAKTSGRRPAGGSTGASKGGGPGGRGGRGERVRSGGKGGRGGMESPRKVQAGTPVEGERGQEKPVLGEASVSAWGEAVKGEAVKGEEQRRTGRKRPFRRKGPAGKGGRSGTGDSGGTGGRGAAGRPARDKDKARETKGERGPGAGRGGGERKAGPPRRKRRPGQGPGPGARRGKRPEPAARPGAGTASTDARLDFYVNKYSDTSTAEKPAKKKEKKDGVLKRVIKVFRKKS
jgi:ATP-dependent RNA helicase RhlB